MIPPATDKTAARDDGEEVRRRAAEDVRLARALAEAGRRAPLLGGEVYVTWGLAVAAGLVVNWAIVVKAIAVSSWTIALSWFVLMSAAGLISARIQNSLAGRTGAVGIGNSVSSAVWRAAGAFLGVFALTLFAAGLVSPFDPGASGAERGRWISAGFSMFTPASFGVYAIAMEASSAAAQAPWLRVFSRLSFASMAVLIVMANSPSQLLIAAGCAIMVLALPGALMMRQARGNFDG